VAEPRPNLADAAPSVAPDDAARSRVADQALVAACWLAIAFLLAQILMYGYGRDQGIYAMVGRAVAAGKMPYRDAWDFKPPGIFLIYALARGLFGSAQVGIRIVECAGLAAMVWAMMRLSDRLWGDRRIGLVAGVVSVLVHAQLDFWHTAQPESFGGMLTIFGLLVLGRDPALIGEDVPPLADRERMLRRLASGALFGLTGLLKPPLAGGGAVVAAALALEAWRAHRSIAQAARAVVPIVAGGASPLVLCLAWFAAKGALRDLYRVLFVFTPHYTALSWEGETLSGMTYWGFTEWLCTYSSVATVGVILVLVFQPRKRERPAVFVIAAIIAVHIAGVIMQGKFFPYHYGATWPVTGMLAGLGFFRIWERLSARGAIGVAVFFAIVFASAMGRTATKDVPHSYRERCWERIQAYGRSPRDQAEIDRLASVADVNAGANRAVADFLRARTPADRPVFVWGFEPVIYDLADRSPATRYLYDVPQRVAWAKAKERETLMRDLDARRPSAVVVERRDVFPMVTGDAVDSADTLADFPALHDLLRDRYRLETTIEDFDIYLER
jgi:hypothetical protein